MKTLILTEKIDAGCQVAEALWNLGVKDSYDGLKVDADVAAMSDDEITTEMDKIASKDSDRTLGLK